MPVPCNEQVQAGHVRQRRYEFALDALFELVLLGGVRLIRESQKKKGYTAAEVFFVPFHRIHLSEFVPMRHIMEDKETPLPFHYLDTLETQG